MSRELLESNRGAQKITASKRERGRCYARSWSSQPPNGAGWHWLCQCWLRARFRVRRDPLAGASCLYQDKHILYRILDHRIAIWVPRPARTQVGSDYRFVKPSELGSRQVIAMRRISNECPTCCFRSRHLAIIRRNRDREPTTIQRAVAMSFPLGSFPLG
jgi:hypothetical protein